MSSAHVGWTTADEFDAALDLHPASGATPSSCPSSRRRRSPISTRLHDCRDAECGLRARSPTGMTLGYHNHFWELERVIDDRPALLHLFDLVAPDVVAEVDIYWAQWAVSDPVTVVAALGPTRRAAAREGRPGRHAREPDGRGRRRRDRRPARARQRRQTRGGTSSSSIVATPTCSTRSSGATTTSWGTGSRRGST